MNRDHDYCRFLLGMARRTVKQDGVEVPKGLTAIRADKHQFFVEAIGVKGEYVKAHCAYDAKWKYLCRLIDANDAKAKVQ